MDYIELEHKASIVMEEINTIYWEEMDPEDPFRSLARRMLSNPGIGRMKKLTNWTAERATEFNVDGIVLVNQWLGPMREINAWIS